MLQILGCDMVPFLPMLPKQLVSNRGRPDDEQAGVHDIQRRLKELIMTLRTYTYYICPNGHRGHELLSENDQPYSKTWERTTTESITGRQGVDETSFYVCSTCGQTA